MAILVLLPLLGALGFALVEDMRPIDAIYMSFITLSTVGYEVVKPLSDNGKIFVVVFLIISFASFFYALSQIGEMLVGGDLKRLIQRRLMENQIENLKNHTIICGLGRMGQSIAVELHKKDRKFVIIDLSNEKIDLAMREGWTCIKGDVSDDTVLEAAGIKKAHCLVTVLPHDPDNLFCVMAARLLNKELSVIARSNAESSVQKLKRAGATHVVSPYSTGAVKISQLVMHPELEDFMEIFSKRAADVDLSVVRVGKDSIFYGKTLRSLNLINHDIMVIGIKTGDGKVDFPPDMDRVLDTVHSLILIGRTTRLNEIYSIDS